MTWTRYWLNEMATPPFSASRDLIAILPQVLGHEEPADRECEVGMHQPTSHRERNRRWIAWTAAPATGVCGPRALRDRNAAAGRGPILRAQSVLEKLENGQTVNDEELVRMPIDDEDFPF